MKKILYLILATASLTAIFSCSNNSNKHWHAELAGNDLIITGDSCSELAITWTLSNEAYFDTIVKQYDGSALHIDLDSNMRRLPESFFPIAYKIATEGRLDLHIQVGESLDTIIPYAPEFQTEGTEEIWANESRGKVAPLTPSNIQSAMTWAKSINMPITEEQASVMSDVLRHYASVQKLEFVRDQLERPIPSIHSFRDSLYNISTNMRADGYILFTTNNEAEMLQFIKAVKKVNYANTSYSVSRPMECFRGRESRGDCVMFLIGFDKVEGTYQVVPVGIININENGLTPLSLSDFQARTATSNNANQTAATEEDDMPRVLSFPTFNVNVTIPNATKMSGGLVAIERGETIGDTQQIKIHWTGDADRVVVSTGNEAPAQPVADSDEFDVPDVPTSVSSTTVTTVNLRGISSPVPLTVPLNATIKVYDLSGNATLLP